MKSSNSNNNQYFGIFGNIIVKIVKGKIVKGMDWALGHSFT